MREVRIRDTLTGDVQPLERGGQVGIYACGPTVYSRIHIGNARPFVVFSLLTPLLGRGGVRPEAGDQRHRRQRQIYRRRARRGRPSDAFAAPDDRRLHREDGPARARPP